MSAANTDTNPLTNSVRIVEVGPRDGLQNEAAPLSMETKLRLIELLAQAGLKIIEAGSFVNPRWVPQMAGSDELFARLDLNNGIHYTALTPNIKGLERALALGIKEVAVFAAASEGFSQKNINCSIAESIERFTQVVEQAREHDVKVRGYISCVIACPYDGEVAPGAVRDLSQTLLDMGCYEISLGDTIGVGTPHSIKRLLDTLQATIAVEKLAMHCHDTYGQAVANIYAAWQQGVRVFDSSVAGLGGCPYAKGASGNVATEDVVYLFNGLGVETGVNLNRLLDATAFITEELQRPPTSKVAQALLAKRQDH